MSVRIRFYTSSFGERSTLPSNARLAPARTLTVE